MIDAYSDLVVEIALEFFCRLFLLNGFRSNLKFLTSKFRSFISKRYAYIVKYNVSYYSLYHFE